MNGLTLGLTFGLAAAGAIGGGFYCFGNHVRTGIGFGSIPKGTLSPKYNFAVAIIGGGVLAGALGFGIGKGIEIWNQPTCQQKDGISITMRDQNGNKTCMSIGDKGLIVVPN